MKARSDSLAFHLMAKPSGAICNLECAYCYFLSKERLYPGSDFRMSDTTLETYVRQMIEAQAVPDVTFAWQGGEPTLMGLEFFERAFKLQQRYRRPGMRIHNTIQTNGTRLDDAWGRFLTEHDVLVGISIDGPKDLHDTYRRDKGGVGSFERVIDGLEVLKRHGASFNVLTTVHHANANHPLRVYRFLRDELGVRYMQFIPIVERDNITGYQEGEALTSRSVTGRQYGRFLNAVYDEWVTRDVGTVYVQLFDVTLAKYVGEGGGLCIFEETCGNALALEHNGDVFACDHYVQPDHLLGNIGEQPLLDMVQSQQQRAFGDAKRATLPTQCRVCDVRWLCQGGCPKNRVRQTTDEGSRLNALCEGYYAYFHHTRASMEYMAGELKERRAPARVMEWVANTRRESLASRQPPGRNDLCPCGSGMKYKHCCARLV